MKKLIILSLTLLATHTAIALPLGNPQEPALMRDGVFWEGLYANFCDPYVDWYDTLSLRLGFYGDYVFNKHMEEKKGDHQGDDIEHFSLNTNAIYAVIGLYDRFDLFGTYGGTNLQIQSNAQTFGFPENSRVKIRTNTAESWSVGARGVLWQCHCINLGMEGQYFQTQPDISNTVLADQRTTGPHPKLNYQEWQVGLGISTRIQNFSPYAGVTWSRADADFDAFDFNPVDGLPDLTFPAQSFKSRLHTGYAIGLTFVDCEKATVTVEGRFINEKALYLNGQFRF